MTVILLQDLNEADDVAAPNLKFGALVVLVERSGKPSVSKYFWDTGMYAHDELAN